ncbi:MAG: hypothetical protein FD174_2197 [Geobacteraceae bacterium]|nr:MAG: hypothetical protein FD174_2197 [Geobacteraceae bacterium]
MRIFRQSVTCKRLPCIFTLLLLLGAIAEIGGTEVQGAEIEKSPPVQVGGTAQEAGAETPKGPDPAPDKRDEMINDLLRRMEMLEKEIRSLQGGAEKIFLPSEAAPAPPPGKADEEERIAQAALERTLIERSGILLPHGTLEIEPSLTFAHASSDNISIDGVTLDFLAIGKIISDKIRRNILIPALTFRLGLQNDFQVETKFPLRYDSQRTLKGDNTERTKESFGLGDIELALSHQLLREKGWVPDILGSLRWKTDTGHSPFSLGTDELALGTGFHALQFMLTAVKVKEPAAFFGSLLYTINFPVSKAEGRVSPGDTYGINLGLALALNLDTSINFIWEQRFTDSAELDGVKIPGTALYPGNFRVGATYTFTPSVALDASIVIGLTRDAPDVQAIVAIPVRFQNFLYPTGP